MGKLSRTKGATGEREIVNLLKQQGISAQRISMMETGGIDKGDVSVNGKIGQVKRGSHIPKFVYDALGDYEYLFLRRDREQWVVVMPLQTFIDSIG